MRIFLPPLEIAEMEGFNPKRDIFGRAIHGQRLTSLFTRVDQPLVVAVDAQWGSGKTTFLKMWAGQLRKDGFPVIYFDAFEHDYADDAFGALAAQIIALAEDTKKANEDSTKRFVAAAVSRRA